VVSSKLHGQASVTRRARAVRVCAFTLIELLVVVAIVTLLAALLTPALRSARESAKETACRNNLRQLGAAIHIYAQDFSDYGPIANIDGVSLWWSQKEHVFIKYVIHGFDPASLPGYYYVCDRSVFLCPSVPAKGILSTTYVFGTYGGNALWGWGANYKLGGCQTPSATHLLGDGASPGHYYYHTYAMDFRHRARFLSQATYEGIHDGPNSMAIVVLVDGHVEAKRYSDLHVMNAAHAVPNQQGGAATCFGNGDCHNSHKEFWAPAPGVL